MEKNKCEYADDTDKKDSAGDVDDDVMDNVYTNGRNKAGVHLCHSAI